MRWPVYKLPSMVIKAIEEDRRRQAWDIWVQLYPNFTSSNFMPFEDFIEKLFVPGATQDITDEEIEAEFEDIIKRDREEA